METSYGSDYYAAQISALTVSPNSDYYAGTVFVKHTSRSYGKKAKITTYPAAAAKYVKIINRTTNSSHGSSTTFSTHRAYGTNKITVRGRVPVGRSTDSGLITVDKPDLYAGAVFRSELAKLKIKVDGPTQDHDHAGRPADHGGQRHLDAAGRPSGPVHETVKQHACGDADQGDEPRGRRVRHLVRRPGSHKELFEESRSADVRCCAHGRLGSPPGATS